MKDSYTYIAVLTYDVDGISIEFPDLPGCFPCADDSLEAVKNANEALRLHLWGMEQDGDEIPEPSSVHEIKLEKGQSHLLVEAFMPPIRERQSNKFIKKTLSIPRWLNEEAERAGVNFSQLLQNSLKEYLGVKG
ncbi:MAG: type II toxin-antitoxin system HicB family antitoxin [Clostridiales bacterium]|jgi:predicted RNase H-like HicB family nuclease|nr:type II toxin-antitoxin system HicB family antitoxin [Clostridiales bacterium]